MLPALKELSLPTAVSHMSSNAEHARHNTLVLLLHDKIKRLICELQGINVGLVINIILIGEIM